jgi:hypothetical protein
MEGAITLVPLAVILLLVLPPLRLHMMIAGLVGGIVAMIIGGYGVGDVTGFYLSGLTQIMSITAIMVLAATAKLLSEMGAIEAIVNFSTRIFKGRLYLAAGLFVLIQASAVYAAGLGAGNTIVTAPMVNSIMGFVPEVVAAMSIVSPTSWATSPSSAESAYISEQWGVDVQTYASHMRPYVFVMWGLATILAVWGVYRRGITAEPSEEGVEEKPMGELAVRASPFIVFLILILIGPWVNQFSGITIFTPITNALIVISLGLSIFWDEEKTWRENLNDTGELFINSGRPILNYLFLAGSFLGFIKVLENLGTFSTLAGYVEFAPTWAILIAAMVIGFLVAVPAGAYTVATDILIIPTLAQAGVEGSTFGFVAMAVAYGAMISPVQINVAATAEGFGVEIPEVISNNTPYMPAALVALMILLAVTGVLF